MTTTMTWSESTPARRAALGAGAVAVAWARDAGGLGLRATVVVWRTPLAAPARALAGMAERRGEQEETRLVAGVRQACADVLERALSSDALARQVAAVLDQPALEGMIERALASRFAQMATDQVLASDELRRVVDHVARSDEVRTALTAQSRGLVDDVGDELRVRTTKVDDRLEGVARRMLRRRPQLAPFVELKDGPAPA